MAWIKFVLRNDGVGVTTHAKKPLYLTPNYWGRCRPPHSVSFCAWADVQEYRDLPGQAGTVAVVSQEGQFPRIGYGDSLASAKQEYKEYQAAYLQAAEAEAHRRQKAYTDTKNELDNLQAAERKGY